MANPRRASLQSHPHILPLSTSSSSSSSILNSLSLFLKRPQAFPFLLSIFVLLTWLSLRYSSSSSHFHESKWHRNLDLDANLVRLSTSVKDERGWIVNPVSLALENGIHGEIRAGRTRGNHRHHTCNETFIIWGAEIKFRQKHNSKSKSQRRVKVIKQSLRDQGRIKNSRKYKTYQSVQRARSKSKSKATLNKARSKGGSAKVFKEEAKTLKDQRSTKHAS